MNNSFVAFVLSVFLFQNAFSQELHCRIYDEKSVPRERWVDFERAVVDLTIDPQGKAVNGVVKFTFSPLRTEVDSLWLDGPGIEVDSVLANGNRIGFKTFDKGLAAFPEQPWQRAASYELAVFYKAKPRKGMYFTGWNDASGKTPKQVWTQGQGIDNSHWFPHFDDLSDKLLTETIITFDTGFSILSNGTLLSKEVVGSKQRVQYAMQKPHSSYLVMIAIGDYGIDSVMTSSGTPIRNWYYNSTPEKMEPTFRGTTELMEFLESYTGVSYPWESYSQVPVHDFLYGAMENTTATIFSDKFYVDSVEFAMANYVYVNAHEMAHQWFGNLVTAGSSEAHWLHEGFATYLHTLWQGEYLGDEEGILLAESNRQTALQAGKADDFPITDSRAGSSRHYMKAATVLRMLHDEVGEDCFKATIKHFLEKHAYKTIYTHDFLRSFHEVCGESMNTFFNQWVYKGREPSITLELLNGYLGERGTFLSFTYDSGSVDLPFSLSVPVAIMGKGTYRECVYKITGDTVITLSAVSPEKLDWIEVDMHRHLLVDWNWNSRSEKHLSSLAVSGGSILSRADALVELGKREALSSKLVKGVIESEQSDFVISKLIDLKPKSISKEDLEDLLSRKGYSRTKQSVLLRYPEHAHSLVQSIGFESLDNSSIQWYLMALIREQVVLMSQESTKLASRVSLYPELQLYYYQYQLQLGNQEAFTRLVELTHESVDFNVRIDAFDVLITLEYRDVELYRNLHQALNSFNRRLKSGAKSALNKTLTVDIANYLEAKGEHELSQFYKNL